MQVLLEAPSLIFLDLRVKERQCNGIGIEKRLANSQKRIVSSLIINQVRLSSGVIDFKGDRISPKLTQINDIGISRQIHSVSRGWLAQTIRLFQCFDSRNRYNQI